MTPPPLADIAKEAGVHLPLARKAMVLLCEQEHAWQANPDLFFDYDAIQECRRTIIGHFEGGGEGTVAALRDALGTTRKYTVPLLEGLDRCGFARRYVDNSRQLEDPTA